VDVDGSDQCQWMDEDRSGSQQLRPLLTWSIERRTDLASGHKIVRNHKIVRLRILTSSLLANRRFVLNARGARSTEDQ
jgi:hypothetical protein